MSETAFCDVSLLPIGFSSVLAPLIMIIPVFSKIAMIYIIYVNEDIHS